MSLYHWMKSYRERKRQYMDMGFPVHLAAERAHWDVNAIAEPRS